MKSTGPFLLGLLLVALGACNAKGDRLELERLSPGAFDPTRYDPGPRPLPRGPLPERIVFGTPPFFSAERQAEGLALISQYLAKEIGVPVDTRVAPTYQASVEDLREGRTHVAQLSPFSVVVAEQKIDDLEPLAVTVAQGTTTYAAYLVVAAGSDIESWTQLRGRRLGVTDRWSASGYLYPRAWLEERGLDFEEDIEAVWLGSHDKVLQALLEGEVDAAALSSDTLVAHRALGLSGGVRIIAKTGRIPYDAVVTRRSVDPTLVWALRKAFLTLSVHHPRGARVLERYNATSGFMPPPDGHYDEVREVAARLGVGK